MARATLDWAARSGWAPAAGRSSNFQVLSFESDLQNAENARLSTVIAYLNAQTQLDLTLGMTLESWDIILNDH